MTRSIDFRIGRLYVANSLSTPNGVVVPRPFDVRHIWRMPTGRTVGGWPSLSTYDGMDWIYGACNQLNYQALRNAFQPSDSRVWVHIYDPDRNTGTWYQGTMSEPHVERGAGTTITSVVVSFRSLIVYE